MKRRTLTLALLLTAAIAGVAYVSTSAAAGPQRRRATTQRRASAPRQRVDYTNFSHSTAAHRKDSCASCHKSPSDNWAQARDASTAFPDITDYPEHASCLNCHRQQFFRGARPAICAVCHTVVSPRSGARFPFANPAEAFARSEKGRASASEFAVIFPHDVHQDVMARGTQGSEGGVRFVRAAFAQERPAPQKPNSCSVCHVTYVKPGQAATPATPAPADAKAGDGAAPTLPAGLLKTTPTGHESCFSCHWQDGGEKPVSTDCAGCHRLLPKDAARPQLKGKDADAQFAAGAGFTDPFIVRKLMRRDSVRFSHEEERHREIDCATCHTRIPALNTLDETTLKVPILSCGAGSSCHIGAKPKKILNEEVDKKLADPNFQCVKCHNALGREKPPKSHLEATGK